MKESSQRLDLSVVIPVYNEEDSVVFLYEEIIEVLQDLDRSTGKSLGDSENSFRYEIIFVDDGSEDSTFEKLKQLNPIKIVRFRRNFGQTAAMDAGI